jgi:GNAT superfamily N-acetyltransferase
MIRRCLISYLRFLYLLTINLPYLGKPPADKMEFALSTFRQAFGRDLDYLDKLFYYLYGNQLILIYEIQEKKAAFAFFRIAWSSHIHCPYFGFEESFKKKGVAGKFVTHIFKYWKQKGFKTMSAHIMNDNVLSIRLLTLYDFKLVKSEQNRGYYLKVL